MVVPQPWPRIKRSRKMTMTELREHVMPNIGIDDATPACRVVGAGAEVSGKQGHLYTLGISAQSVGARRIHLQIVKIPPDGRANAHKHDGHETAIYVLSGESGMWYGERLEQHLIARAGEFLYIPANMPHLQRIGELRRVRCAHRPQ